MAAACSSLTVPDLRSEHDRERDRHREPARRALGISEWRVDDRPGYLVPLVEGRFDFQFLVFDHEQTPAERPLRLVRFRTDRTDDAEVRDLTVLVTAS